MTERGRTGAPLTSRAYVNTHDEVDEEYSEDEQSGPSSSGPSSLVNEQASDGDYVASDASVEEAGSYGPHFSAKRHLSCGNPSHDSLEDKIVGNSWRLSDKLKTSHAALVVCLNIDVDPPDVVKTNPCAVLECWVDPHSLPSNKALEAIGNNLHHQFECLSPRMKFKPYLDPSFEETKKFCLNLRKMAKEERCLFYYNGHGVPKPTASGELWVFNTTYSQYIPVSLIEVQNWLGSPCIYIWDCSAAGNLLSSFVKFAEKRDAEAIAMHGGYPEGVQPFMECLQLAACLAHEQLPMSPLHPADLFTSCLTSPIDMALRWYVLTGNLPPTINYDMVHRLPGDLKDRRTPLGELNWIFTSITDTIAWTTFSREIFNKLYRSDLLVASLFRNFLLAERIMKNFHCTPHTYPPLPPTNTHPMWAQWDLAVDAMLRQLPDLLRNEETGIKKEISVPPEKDHSHTQSRFFTDHLRAFDVWISRGGSALTRLGPGSLAPASTDGVFEAGPVNGDLRSVGNPHRLLPRKPPEQLPIVLQLLLSQPHRAQALALLARFVDLGPWAVQCALQIGIYPFITKLLQSPATELRPILIFIWARILAVDPSCQGDLHRNNQGYKYFANALALHDDVNTSFSNASEQRAMCCFILSAICRGEPAAQMSCWEAHVFDNCYERLDEADFLPRQWMALCIGQMWDGNDDMKIYGVDRGTQDKLLSMLSDKSPEVRTAALFALGTFMGASGSAKVKARGGDGTGSMYHVDERTHCRLEVLVATTAALATKDDASPMVRKELLIVLSCFVKEWRGYFVVVSWLYVEAEQRRIGLGQRQKVTEDVYGEAINEWVERLEDEEGYHKDSRVLFTSFYTLYAFLLEMAADPYPEVAAYAQTLVDYITALLLESPFSRLDNHFLNIASQASPKSSSEPRSRLSSIQSSISIASGPATRIPLTRTDSASSATSSRSSNIIRRTASFANSLKSLANSYAFPTSQTDDSIHSSSQQQGLKIKIEDPDLSRPPSPNLNIRGYVSPYSSVPHGIAESSHSHLTENGPCNFEFTDVINALVGEDFERLKVRRRKKNQPRHYQQHVNTSEGVTSPSGKAFPHQSSPITASVDLGLGTGANLPDVLPFKSCFYDWCCEYFTETQMRQPENQEPGSEKYNEQIWRQERNEKIKIETAAQSEIARHCQWDRSVATISHSGYPIKLAFHGYDPLLFVANEANLISVYDWTKRKRVLQFNNGNSLGTSITSLNCINEEVGGMVMSGSSDGIVRLFRNYDASLPNEPLQMVTAFRALSGLIPLRRGSGLVLDWSQNTGMILAGGDSRIIRLWDAHREYAKTEIVTQSESPVTTLSSDPEFPSLFVAGFGDGSLQLFDRRLDNEDGIVRCFRGHSSWVQGARWQKGAGKDFVSASLDGEVKVWDVRRSKNPLTSWRVYPEGLSAFDVHNECSVFAASATISRRARNHLTLVHSLHADPPNQPNVLSRLSFHSTTTNTAQRELPTQCHASPCNLAFHPKEMILGIGCPDGSVRLQGCKFPDPTDSNGLQALWDTQTANGFLSSIRSISP